MASNLPTPLDIQNNQPFNKAVMDAAFTYIVNRFLALESFQPSWQQAVNQLNDVGLNRINAALQPVYNAYSQIASLGAIFGATSSSSITVGTGIAIFVIDADHRNQFAPARWMSALSGDTTASMAGLVTSFDRASGDLVIDIQETYGSGTFSAWQLSPSSPPVIAAAVLDGGVYDAQTVEIDTVPYLYDGLQQRSEEMDGGTF